MINVMEFGNIDLLFVGVAVAATCILGFTIYFNDRGSVTNRTFLFFSLITAIWGTVNYLNYQTSNPFLILWLLRLVMFFAIWQSFFLFRLFYVFPLREFVFPKIYKVFILPISIVAAGLTLSPLVFSRIVTVSSIGEVSNPDRGPGLIFFGVVAIGLVISSITLLWKKMRRIDHDERGPFKLMLWGIFIMFALIIAFNFIVPVITNNRSLIPLGALFTLPFVLFTSYAIYKHKLFNLKVAAVSFVSFILTIFAFFNLLYAEDSSQKILNATFFLAILVGSIILIKTILREVSLREEVQVANTQQTNLIRFISHEVKGALGKSRGFSSLIADGNFGEVPPKLKEMSADVFKTTTKGVEMVEDILNASNIRKGTFSYEKKVFDFKNMVTSIAEGFRATAEGKSLAFTVQTPEGDLPFTGDEKQLSHVVKNLVDNSVRYTTNGSVTVLLEKTGDLLRFKVTDTGFGLSDEDKKNLFTEGGKGKESQKVNVESTGYGLYIVKGIVLAHGGRVWADSPGRSHGSSFVVELPVITTPPPAAPVQAEPTTPTATTPPTGIPEQKV